MMERCTKRFGRVYVGGWDDDKRHTWMRKMTYSVRRIYVGGNWKDDNGICGVR